MRGAPLLPCLLLGAIVALSPMHVAAQAATDAEARALFNAGEIAFGDGRWESALDYFQRAYELSHRPALLFNIGSAAEHIRQDAVALQAFRDYLAQVPDAPNRTAVESRIAVLERAVASSRETTPTATETRPPPPDAPTDAPASDEPSSDVPPAPAPPSPPASGGGDPAPWALVGVGGAVAIAGAVLVGVGFGDLSTVENAPDGTHLAEISAAHDRTPVLTGTGWAALGIGVALAAAGIGWGVAGGASGDARVTGSAWLDDRSGGVVVRGTF